MFDDDQPILRDYLLQSPDNLSKGILFAILSIRERLYNVETNMRDVLSGQDDSALWGFKHKAFMSLMNNKNILYFDLMEDCAAVDFVLYTLANKQHGLGLVKAGFVTTMLTGKSGCLDSVNCRLYGVDKRKLSWYNDGNFKRVLAYNALTEELGGSRLLWDNWCIEIAKTYPARFQTANHVSKYIVEAITS